MQIMLSLSLLAKFKTNQPTLHTQQVNHWTWQKYNFVSDQILIQSSHSPKKFATVECADSPPAPPEIRGLSSLVIVCMQIRKLFLDLEHQFNTFLNILEKVHNSLIRKFDFHPRNVISEKEVINVTNVRKWITLDSALLVAWLEFLAKFFLLFYSFSNLLKKIGTSQRRSFFLQLFLLHNNLSKKKKWESRNFL